MKCPIGVKMPALLHGSACCKHQLKGAVKNDFIAISKAAEHSNPAAIVHSKIGVQSDGFVRVIRRASKDNWPNAIALDCRQGDGQFRSR